MIMSIIRTKRMLFQKQATKEIFIPLFLYTSIALFVSRSILLSNGTIGLFHDWFIGPFPEMIAKYGYDGFQLYDTKVGNKVYPSDWLFRILLIPFAFFGGEIISKSMLLLFITLSGFSMFHFGNKTLKLDYYWSFIAGLIYIFSPIIFTKAVAGHMYYLVGYSLTPLLLMVFHKAQEAKKNILAYSIVSGIIFGFTGVQIHFFVMNFIIVLLLVLINYNNLKKSLFVFVLTVLIGLFLHLPWLLPMSLTPPTITTLKTFLTYHEMINSSTLLESIRILGYNIQPYSYTKLVAQGIVPYWILIGNFLTPIIAALALIIKRDKYTLTFGLILIIGIFISKGINPPFEDVFILLFKHTPLVIFREIWHSIFLIVLSYTILISVSLYKITEKMRRKGKYIKIYAFTTILVIIIIISNGYPLLLGNFAGYMQTYSLNEEYYNLYKTLQNDSTQYRILWLPSISPMKYDDKLLYGFDPLIKYSPKPSFPPPFLPHSRLPFITSVIHENMTKQFGKILSLFATKYVIERNDFTSKYPNYTHLGLYQYLLRKWEQNVTSNFMKNQQDLILEHQTSKFKLYRNTNPSEFIYAPRIIVYGTDDLSILTHLVKVANLTDIAYLTDMEQFETNDPIFILKDNGFDLIPIITGVKIDPGNYVIETDPQKGWINSKNWFWYNYLFASTINNGAFTKTNSQLSIPIEVESPSEIWVKVLKWPKGGKVSFILDNWKEYTINTLSNTFALEWIKLDGKLNRTLTISNIEGENYVDKILISDKQQTDQLLATKLRNATIIYIIEPTSFDINLVLNPSFEELEDEYTSYWSFPETGFTAIVDNKMVNHGHSSLKVTTSINSTRWSFIRSVEIPVTQGEYNIITHMKQENAKASHIVIEGFNKTSNSWLQLIQIPAGQDGSYDWKVFKTSLQVNEDITLLRIALNAGWVLDETKGNATTWFDNISISPIDFAITNARRNLTILKEANYKIFAEISGNARITISNQTFNETFNINSSQYNLINIGSIFLKKGDYELKIEMPRNTRIGTIWIYTSPQDVPTIQEVFLKNVRRAEILEQKQESPTFWRVKVNATTSFLLAFADHYNREWHAYVSNERYQLIPLYGSINGFWINQTGLLEITIEYEPQRWFYIGSIISVTTLIVCITYLIYNWTKNHSQTKKLTY